MTRLVTSLLFCALIHTAHAGSFALVDGSDDADISGNVVVGSFDAESQVEILSRSYENLEASNDANYDPKYAYHNSYNPAKLVTTGADGKAVSATANLSPKAETYFYYEAEETSYEKASWWETYTAEGPSTPVDTMYNIDGSYSHTAEVGSDEGDGASAELASLEAQQENYEELTMRYDYSYDQTIAYHNSYNPSQLVTTGADGKPVTATADLSPQAAEYAYYEAEDSSYEKASWWENFAAEGPAKPVDTMFDHSEATFSSLELRAKSEETPVDATQNSFFIVAASSMVAAAVAVVALVVHRRVNSGSVWTPGSSTSSSRMCDEDNSDFEISFV
jgi:hypothetical protein